MRWLNILGDGGQGDVVVFYAGDGSSVARDGLDTDTWLIMLVL